MSKPQISVAICTYNRSGYLRKALASLTLQTVEVGRFEIIVVDNASTDDTRSVTEGFRQAMPNLRYTFEGSLGLSRARNRALREARGEFIAFLDDDAIASRQWLTKLLECFEHVEPTPGCVGGKAEPVWEAPRPDWLPDELLGFLTIVDWSDKAMFLDITKQYVAGANMAFPLAVLREIGGFDNSLGRVGSSLISGEELLVMRRLTERGYGIFYEPSAVVQHHVPAKRLKKRWFYNRVFSEGQSQAILTARLCTYSRRQKILRAAAHLSRLVIAPKDFACLMLPVAKPNRFARRCRAIQELGFAWGYVADLRAD